MFTPLKKTAIPLITILSSQITFGQTLTCQTSCPQAGEIFAVRTSSPVSSSPGANQVWNFSTISAVSLSTYLVTYKAASSIPSASLHPNADLLKSGNRGNIFLRVGNDGIRKTSPSSYTITADAMELPLPFTYGDAYSETVVSKALSGSDTLVTIVNSWFNAQGSGTLILPSGTFNDVLVIKYTSNWSTKKNGVPFGYSNSITAYYYYSPYFSHPLLYTEQKYTTGPQDYYPYTEFLDHVVLGLNEKMKKEDDEMIVFPNPASDRVDIKVPAGAKGTIVLKNTLGQQLIKQTIEELSYALDISSLPKGIYMVSFSTDTYTIHKKLHIER